MIRVVAIMSLSLLLVLVLYLPSAHPPEDFIAQLRTESGQMREIWSLAHAERALDRTLDAQEAAQPFNPTPNRSQAPGTRHVDSAVAGEMSAVNTRLFGNPYFRSIDALLLLAIYRLFVLLEWLPWLAAFAGAALMDGMTMGAVKAKQFSHHDPEVFALHACAAIVTLCATVLALVMPVTLPPLLMPSVPVALAIFVGGALRNFHRRG